MGRLLNIYHDIRRIIADQRIYHSQIWHRGHEAGVVYERATRPRDVAFNKRMQTYYYKHVNDCMSIGCHLCKEISDEQQR